MAFERMHRLKQLQQLVRDSEYEVDEHSVADAILARAEAHRAVMEAMFRYDAREHPGPERTPPPPKRTRRDLDLGHELDLAGDPEQGRDFDLNEDSDPGRGLDPDQEFLQEDDRKSA